MSYQRMSTLTSVAHRVGIAVAKSRPTYDTLLWCGFRVVWHWFGMSSARDSYTKQRISETLFKNRIVFAYSRLLGWAGYLEGTYKSTLSPGAKRQTHRCGAKRTAAAPNVPLRRQTHRCGAKRTTAAPNAPQFISSF